MKSEPGHQHHLRARPLRKESDRISRVLTAFKNRSRVTDHLPMTLAGTPTLRDAATARQEDESSIHQHWTIQCWEDAMHREVGHRIHRVIQRLVSDGADACDVRAAVHDLWKLDPCGGTTAASARLRCVTAVSVYMQRLVPSSDWSLVGCEVPGPDCRVDIVWQHTRSNTVVFDEIKTGGVDVQRDAQLRDQLTRLAQFGQAAHGEAFGGVRLAPVAAPALCVMWRLDSNGQLASDVLLDGLGVR